MNEQPPSPVAKSEVPRCWHPDCLNVSLDDVARLNVQRQPMVFNSDEELRQHALEKHGIRP